MVSADKELSVNLFDCLYSLTRARLVEHEHLGLHRNNARDGDAALLSAGEGERRFFQQIVGKPRKVRGFAHAAVDLVFG